MARGGVVVFNVLSVPYIDFVRLWAASMDALLPARNYFILTLDSRTQAECKRRNVACLELPTKGLFVRRPPWVDDRDHDARMCIFSDTWYRVGAAKITVLAEIVRLNVSAIFSETDVLWRSPPPEVLRRQPDAQARPPRPRRARAARGPCRRLTSRARAQLLIAREDHWANVGVIAVRGGESEASRMMQARRAR